MKILVGDKGNIDFDEPIRMTTEQKEKFVEFLKSIFAVIEEDYISEIRSERIGDKSFDRRWSIDEYALLLENKNSTEIAERLGRTWTSTHMKRGPFYSEYYAWCKKNSRNLLKENIKDLIKDFLEYKELLKKEKRRERKLEKMSYWEIEAKIAHLKNEISRIRSMKKNLYKDDTEKIEDCKKKIKELRNEIEIYEKIKNNG